MKQYIRLVTSLWVFFAPCGAFAGDIRDIRPPVYFAPNYTFLFLLVLIVFIAVGIIFVMLQIKRNRRAETFTEPFLRPPHEIAYEALRELAAKNLPAQGLMKEYYSALSGIVRYYLEARFGCRAPEMTTEEFLQALRNSQYLDGRQKNLLKDFLTHCDLVKFAKYGPSPVEIEESFRSAGRLIDETKPHEPQPGLQSNEKGRAL